LEARLVLSSTTGLPIPALNSLPGAPAELYLNFGGDTVSSWLGHSNITIPSFATEGDGAPLTQTDVNTITGIWQIVAENYAPYDINVTTVDPRTLTGYKGGVSQIDIGGNGSWTGGTYGGYSQVGGFSGSSASNPVRGFVFPDNLANGNIWYTGEATTHESGHTMGLVHQSTYSGTTEVNEYSTGPGDGTAPIMGNSYYVSRGMWWYGTDDVSSTTYQNDMAVIASNGFPYRPMATGNTIATAAPLTLNGSQVSASGIIESMSQVDQWSFTTDTGTVSLSVAAPSYGNLHPKIELLDSSGNVVSDWQDPDAGSVSWSGTLSAGTYELVIGSHGISSGATSTNYGFDVGTYSVTGTINPPTNLVAAPTGLTLVSSTSGSSAQATLSWTNNATNATDELVERSSNGGTTFTQIADLTAGTSSYTDTGLTQGGTYIYRVRAYDASTGKDSLYSNSATTTTPVSVQTIPAAPSNLNAKAISSTQIQLTWTNNATNASGFVIERAAYNAKGKLGSWTQLATVGSTAISYIDGQVSGSTSYDYRIRAYNSAGYSTYDYAAQSKVQPSSSVKGHSKGAGIEVPSLSVPHRRAETHAHQSKGAAIKTPTSYASADPLEILLLAPSGADSSTLSNAGPSSSPWSKLDISWLDKPATYLVLERARHQPEADGTTPGHRFRS
jgi:hypothetical protein